MKFKSMETSQKPTIKEVNDELDKIEKATNFEEEKDANKVGLPLKYYKELYKLPVSNPNTESQTVEHFSLGDFVKKWEKENIDETQHDYEELPMNIKIINNTQYAMSEFFLAAVVRSARVATWNDNSKKYKKNTLNNLLNISKIEIKEIKGTDNLQFDIYVSKRSINFKKNTEIVFLEMYPNGEIKLI